jgi:hypothetical protein
MALAFDAVSNAIVQTGANDDQNSTATLTLAGTATLAVLFIEASLEGGNSDASFVNAFSTLTLGGVTLTRVSSAIRHSADGTSGFVDIYYGKTTNSGGSIGTGSQTLSITPNHNVGGSVTDMIARCVSVTGAIDAAIFATPVTNAGSGVSSLTLAFPTTGADDLLLGCCCNGTASPGVTTGTSVSTDTGGTATGSHGGLRVARNSGTGTVNLVFSTNSGDSSGATGVRIIFDAGVLAPAGLATATATALIAAPIIDYILKEDSGKLTLEDGTGFLLGENGTGGASTSAQAGVATVTATANNPTTAGAQPAGLATATATGQDPDPSVKASAGVAAVTATANNPTLTETSNAAAGLATATATGQTPTTAGAQPAGLAAVTATAYNPTVSTTANTSAAAGLATATATANNPTVAAAQPAGLATVTATGLDPKEAAAPVAGSATVTATGQNPTVSTSSATNAVAGLATATATANNPAQSVNASIGVAQATATANGASMLAAALIGRAQVTATAYGPTCTISAGAGAATATTTANNTKCSISTDVGFAAVTATAYGVTLGIPLPPLVPPFAAFLDAYQATTADTYRATTTVAQMVTSTVDTTPRSATVNTTPQGVT